MLSLDDIRKEVPWATGMDDDVLIGHIAKATGKPKDVIAEEFDVFNPKKSRNLGAVANDAVIEGANQAAGGVKAFSDFISPNNAVSRGIQQFIDMGEERQSYATQRSKRELGEALATDEIGPQLKGVWKRVSDYPGQAAMSALGAIAGPGLASAGARGLTTLGRYATKEAAEAAATRAGLGTAMGVSGAMSGGDAAGNAYELVMNSKELAHLPEEQRHAMAVDAARKASIAPFIYGAATGALGAEGAIARGASKGILRTGAVEAGSEFGDEALSAYSGRKAASMYDPTINPMQGVIGQGAMGAVLGGISGATVGALTRQPPETPPPPPNLDDKTKETSLLRPFDRPTDIMQRQYSEHQYRGSPEEAEAYRDTMQDVRQAAMGEGAEQGTLFPPEYFSGPRFEPGPGYQPGLFDADAGTAMPPMQYTAPTVDPAFTAARQAEVAAAQAKAAKEARKAAKAAGVAPTSTTGASAAPGAPTEATQGLYTAVRDAVAAASVLSQEERAALTTTATDKLSLEAKTKAAGKIHTKVKGLLKDAGGIDDIKEYLRAKVMADVEAGGKDARTRAELNLEILYNLEGVPEAQRRGLDDFAELQGFVKEAKEVIATKPEVPAAGTPKPGVAPLVTPGKAESGVGMRQKPVEVTTTVTPAAPRELPLEGGFAPLPPQSLEADTRPSRERLERKQKAAGQQVVVGRQPVQGELEFAEDKPVPLNVKRENVLDGTSKGQLEKVDDVEAGESSRTGSAPKEDVRTVSPEEKAMSDQEAIETGARQFGESRDVADAAGISHGESGEAADTAATDPDSVRKIARQKLLDAPVRHIKSVKELTEAGDTADDVLNELAYKLAEARAATDVESAQKKLDAKIAEVNAEIKHRAALHALARTKTEEDTDAVQERSAEEVDAQEQAGDGEGVGGGNASGQETPAARTAKTRQRRAGKDAETGKAAEAAKPAEPAKPDEAAEASEDPLADIPPSFIQKQELPLRAFDASTGKHVEITHRADEVIASLKQDIETFTKLLKCVKGGK